MYTAVIMIAVNSLGSQNGRHRSVWNSRSGEQEGFNRVYIPFITPRVVDVETNAPTFAFPCELFHSIRAVYGEARKLDGWVWNHCRHPGFCEANNAAVPCFSLVWDARTQFTEFVIQWLNVSQQNGWERRSKGTASQSDKNASSLPLFQLRFFRRGRAFQTKGSDAVSVKIHRRSGTQSPVWLRDGRTDV